MRDYVEMPNGLLLPEELAEDIARKSQLPTAVDLFAGAGGASCGLVQAGFHVVGAADFDPLCAITYMANIGSYPCRFVFAEDGDRARLEKALAKNDRRKDREQRRLELDVPSVSGSGWISSLNPRPPGCDVFFLGDVRKFTGRGMLRELGMEVGDLDLVIGGPPCQGFSRANKNRNVMDPRNSLLFEFARLVLELQPKSIVMENVPGILDMVTPEGLPVIDAFCRVLSDGGFNGLEALKLAMRKQGAVGLTRGKGKDGIRRKARNKSGNKKRRRAT